MLCVKGYEVVDTLNLTRCANKYEWHKISILQNCRALNPQFAKFVENQESRPEVQNKLSALLITPIQRVPRYKLLLMQLLDLTLPAEDSYNSLAGKIWPLHVTVKLLVKADRQTCLLVAFVCWLQY